MGTKYTITIVITGGVFLFSSYKVYERVNRYLYGESLQQPVKQIAKQVEGQEKSTTDIEASTQTITKNQEQTIFQSTSSQQNLQAKKRYERIIRYKNKKAKKVKLAGSFWSWKERDMEKISDGEWEEKLILNQPGSYKYYFIVDGKKVLDPQNPNKTKNGEYSVLEVK